MTPVGKPISSLINPPMKSIINHMILQQFDYGKQTAEIIQCITEFYRNLSNTDKFGYKEGMSPAEKADVLESTEFRKLSLVDKWVGEDLINRGLATMGMALSLCTHYVPTIKNQALKNYFEQVSKYVAMLGINMYEQSEPVPVGFPGDDVKVIMPDEINFQSFMTQYERIIDKADATGFSIKGQDMIPQDVHNGQIINISGRSRKVS